MDGSRAVVEAKTTPIPELEGKDVWCGADFKYDAVCARAVNGACGNEKVVVLFCRPAVNEFIGLEDAFSTLRSRRVHAPSGNDRCRFGRPR